MNATGAVRIAVGLGIVLGMLFVANGSYMLVAPENWYWAIPGVAERGGFNQHFVRDIGIIYVLTGSAFVAGALLPAARLSLWAGATLWHVGHALVHLWEVAAGIGGPEALAQDLAGVSVPSLLGIALVVVARRGRARAA